MWMGTWCAKEGRKRREGGGVFQVLLDLFSARLSCLPLSHTWRPNTHMKTEQTRKKPEIPLTLPPSFFLSFFSSSFLRLLFCSNSKLQIFFSITERRKSQLGTELPPPKKKNPIHLLILYHWIMSLFGIGSRYTYNLSLVFNSCSYQCGMHATTICLYLFKFT